MQNAINLSILCTRWRITRRT